MREGEMRGMRFVKNMRDMRNAIKNVSVGLMGG